MTKNTIEIDYGSNDVLKGLLGDKEIGDSCNLTVTIKVIENKDGVLKATVRKITKDYDDATEASEPTSEQPVAMAMGPTGGTGGAGSNAGSGYEQEEGGA